MRLVVRSIVFELLQVGGRLARAVTRLFNSHACVLAAPGTGRSGMTITRSWQAQRFIGLLVGSVGWTGVGSIPMSGFGVHRWLTSVSTLCTFYTCREVQIHPPSHVANARIQTLQSVEVHPLVVQSQTDTA